MDNSECKKVMSLLLLYIENKLNNEEHSFIENHFKYCESCYSKYIEMKDIVKNLHFEYEKLLQEFDKVEANKEFNIREYEKFYRNISPYIDDELNYDDCIKFRKYLLKSKSGRRDLANAYNLKNSIKNSVAMFKDNLNINFSKKIIKKLKEENQYSFDAVYQRAAILIGIMISTLIAVSLFVSFSYISHFSARANTLTLNNDDYVFPPEEDMIEFSFDENGEALLTYK